MLPPAERVEVRLPHAEGSPTPRDCEVVVFKEHFFRGLGLPTSELFSRFLVFFGLQPRHIAPNAFLQLAAYVTLCKGILGIESRLDLWRNLFYFKKDSAPTEDPIMKKMTPCGATLVHHRSAFGFPKLPLQDSVKKWQWGFFYVKIVDPLHNFINLPPSAIAPLNAKLNWSSSLPEPIPEVKLVCAHVVILKAQGLLARDLLATMVACRILSLQHRPHLICQMDG
ncbi:hypothetical protein D1007_55550 [Hordeum vulgare]|nr:hypothetical protein D1007_55550 [Hordeum vulgare]